MKDYHNIGPFGDTKQCMTLHPSMNKPTVRSPGFHKSVSSLFSWPKFIFPAPAKEGQDYSPASTRAGQVYSSGFHERGLSLFSWLLQGRAKYIQPTSTSVGKVFSPGYHEREAVNNLIERGSSSDKWDLFCVPN
jgi:hypothetical protein